MDTFNETIPQIIKEAGWLAPVLFVVLHLLRPILFLPVIVVCIVGGYLFGFVHGTIYSIIGLTLMSLLFYKVVDVFPSFRTRLTRLKKRVFKDRKMTIGQVMILRMMPFIHFHLLSLYLMEMTSSFKEYMRYSIGGIILPSMLYTAFGQAITEMSWYVSIVFFSILALIFSCLGKRGTSVYKWERFFSRKATEKG